MIRVTRCLAAALLLALPLSLFAQDGSPAQPQKTPEELAKEAAERRVEWQMRMYSSLELSEAQKDQVKKILIDDELATAKQRDERRAKVKEILTPSQREAYDQMIEQQNRGGRGMFGGGGGGGPGGGGFGGMGRMGMDPAQLKERLKLTDDQTTKITAVFTEAAPQWMERFQKMREGGGGFDPTKIREIVNELRVEANKKIEAILTPEQMPEWQKMVKEFDDQMAQWTGGRFPGGGGEGREGRGPREERDLSPEDQIKRRLSAAMTALAMSAEEASAIQPLVEKVIQYQVTAGKAVRDAREAIGKVEGEDQIKLKVDDYRKVRAEYEEKLALLSSGLRELLTVQQEAKLIALRVLELADMKSE